MKGKGKKEARVSGQQVRPDRGAPPIQCSAAPACPCGRSLSPACKIHLHLPPARAARLQPRRPPGAGAAAAAAPASRLHRSPGAGSQCVAAARRFLARSRRSLSLGLRGTRAGGSSSAHVASAPPQPGFLLHAPAAERTSFPAVRPSVRAAAAVAAS